MKTNANGNVSQGNNSTANGHPVANDYNDTRNSNGTFFNTSLKNVFVTFEKAKAPLAILQDLSSANFFVALRPGTQSTEHCKVVEILVPMTTSTVAIQARLQCSFSDVGQVTSDCNLYTVAVPSLCLKQVAEALRNCTYKVGDLNRISNGQAFFTIWTAVSITPSHIAAAFDDAQIEASYIEVANPNPNFQDGSIALAQQLANLTSPLSQALTALGVTPAAFATVYAGFCASTWTQRAGNGNQQSHNGNESTFRQPAGTHAADNNATQGVAPVFVPQLAMA